MKIPDKIKSALDEVRKYHDEVTMVAFNTDGQWHFTDILFNAPERWSPEIDIGILEDAMESITEFPAIFSLD